MHMLQEEEVRLEVPDYFQDHILTTEAEEMLEVLQVKEDSILPPEMNRQYQLQKEGNEFFSFLFQILS